MNKNIEEKILDYCKSKDGFKAVKISVNDSAARVWLILKGKPYGLSNNYGPLTEEDSELLVDLETNISNDLHELLKEDNILNSVSCSLLDYETTAEEDLTLKFERGITEFEINDWDELRNMMNNRNYKEVKFPAVGLNLISSDEQGIVGVFKNNKLRLY